MSPDTRPQEDAAGRAGMLRRLRGRTVALLPALLALGAISRYAESRTGTDPGERTAGAVVIALMLVAALCAGRAIRRGRRERSMDVTTARPTVLAILTTGTLGLGAPLALIAWSRHTLNPNAVGVAAVVTVLFLARRSGRRNLLIAAAAISGTALLVVGRTTGLGFPPVRAAYLSIVSGAVLNLGEALVAIAAVIAAGALTAFLHRRIANAPYIAEARTLLLLLLPAALVTTGAALLDGHTAALRGEMLWTVVAGGTALAQLATIITLVRRSSQLAAAIGVLVAFLPAIVVSSRLQGAPLTTPMRIGAVLVIAAALLLRRTLGSPSRDGTDDSGDR